MNNRIDIDVVIDESLKKPKVIIKTNEMTKQIENIISAIEETARNEYPPILGYTDTGMKLVSQMDIIRIYTHGRKIMFADNEIEYYVKKPLAAVEEGLDPTLFIRISRSEIVNIYKVKKFDISIAGTIGVEFDDGSKSWVARSKIKTIKEFLKTNKGKWRD